VIGERKGMTTGIHGCLGSVRKFVSSIGVEKGLCKKKCEKGFGEDTGNQTGNLGDDTEGTYTEREGGASGA